MAKLLFPFTQGKSISSQFHPHQLQYFDFCHSSNIALLLSPFALNCLNGQGSNHCLYVYKAKLTILRIVTQCCCHLVWNGCQLCCQALCWEWSLSVTALEAQPEMVWESGSLFRMKSWEGLLKHFQYTNAHESNRKKNNSKTSIKCLSWQCLIN